MHTGLACPKRQPLLCSPAFRNLCPQYKERFRDVNVPSCVRLVVVELVVEARTQVAVASVLCRLFCLGLVARGSNELSPLHLTTLLLLEHNIS